MFLVQKISNNIMSKHSFGEVITFQEGLDYLKFYS